MSADRTRLLDWIRDCGGRPVVDSSTSGGSHILVPLAQAATLEDLRPILVALAGLCPTLDISPMLNTATGCITPPGSPCREGGHRRLHGQLSDAIAAFEQRSDPSFLLALGALLAATSPITGPAPAPVDPAVFTETGPDRHLHPNLQRRDPFPAPVRAFAESGILPADRRWRSRSEARQSVLTHAVWRGYTLAEVQHRMQPGNSWAPGLASAYIRYGRHAQRALERDWVTAQRWLATHLPRFQRLTHKKKHTGGTYGTTVHRHWLAHAVWWCDTTHRGSPHRGATTSVLQALAVSAARAGSVVHGVPVVAVGGRSLSLAAGLLSESSVWAILRRLRDTPGAPILLIEKGTGVHADRYALTTPEVIDPTPDAAGRPVVTDVHCAWSALGHQHRRVYELITRAGIRRTADLAVEARVSCSSLYDTLAELARVGVIVRQHGRVSPSEITLDDIADRLRLEEERSARISAHRAARARWHTWLQTRQTPPRPSVPPVAPPLARIHAHYGEQLDDQDHYLSVVLATGPPAA